MVSKFLMSMFCAFSFVGAAQGVKFEQTIGRISYTLDSETKTALINKVYAYWIEDLKVVLPAFVKYDGEVFKVTDIGEDAFITIGLEINEINVPSTINKTKTNKEEFLKINKSLDESSKKKIEDYFKTLN